MSSSTKSASGNLTWSIACLGTIFLVSCQLYAAGPPKTNGLPEPPVARRDHVVDVMHGVRIPDPYRWLENQKSPATRAWINAENKYTHLILSHAAGRRW